MKDGVYLLNTSRGMLIESQALLDALQQKKIAGAGLDVLCQEPMRPENPLFAIKDSRKLIITPHMAWAPVETRERLMRCVYRNIEEIK